MRLRRFNKFGKPEELWLKVCEYIEWRALENPQSYFPEVASMTSSTGMPKYSCEHAYITGGWKTRDREPHPLPPAGQSPGGV